MSDNKSVKVLIVDDSGTIRKTAEAILKREGYTVSTAEDGFSALSKVMSFKPDVIFLDIMMPRLLSSKDSIFDKARGRIAGSEYFMTKPFSRDELLNAIRTHVQ